jgi:hypothetical protein
LPNSKQSYKGKVKTHNFINRQNQSTTGKLCILTRKCINIIIECINVMCTNHTHRIHVFVALEEEETVSDLQILEDYATIIRSDLHKRHGVTVPEVIFLDKNTVKGYMCKICTDGLFHKFHLRDDYF